MCNDFTVVQLKEKLEALKLPKYGKKADLCQRLSDYYKEQLPETKDIYDILIDNPFNLTAPRKGRGPHRVLTRPIAVTGRMLNLLKREPIKYESFRGKKCQGVAYGFGPLLDTNEYVLLETRKTPGTLAIINFNSSISETLEITHQKNFLW